MLEIEEIKGINCFGKQKQKKQIILTHTSRNINDYISSLKFRHNGNYDRVPNYLISREGKVFKALSDKCFSNFFSEPNLNRNSIVISLENLGWLEKIPLSDNYVNWIGDIYKDKVLEKKWRDYFFWQPYTSQQIDVCAKLCKEVLKNNKINNKCVGHNTKIDGIERFEGIASRSNYDSDLTDLSPAFDFEYFLKKIEDEQFV